MNLTLQQKNTLEFIEKYIKNHDISPTTQEIANGIGISSRGVVYRYLKALVQKKYILMTPNKKRNIQLLNSKPSSGLTMPFLGKIAAGMAMDAHTANDAIDVANYFQGPDKFLVKVEGNSMLGDNICDQDLIICKSCNKLETNQIHLFIIDDSEVTLKRAKVNADETITLLPSNPDYQAITLASNRVKIQGKYLGLLRL